MRFCVDYRRLNQANVADAYPLQCMDDCMNSRGNANVFLTIDSNFRYGQFPVEARELHKTCFTTHSGVFQYKLMPFGLFNDPATFQRALYIVLSGLRW